MALRAAFAGVLRQSSQQQIIAPASICCGLQSEMKAKPHEEQVRFASQLVVRQRMKSVANIGKITKAMKMVAAARMRGAQNKVQECRGMTDPCSRIFGENPLVKGTSSTVPITSDKGLCGGVNSQVNRVTRVLQQVVGPDAEDPRIAILGDKGKSVLRRVFPSNIDSTFTDSTKQTITFSTASAIAEEMLQKNYSSCRIVFNRFKSAISFQPTVATVLSQESIEADPALVEKFDEYELEGPDRSEFLQDLSEFNLASTLYWGMLENNCSEQASRVQAMENSSKNASEMLSELTIKYNKTRQAGITTELIEIISGAVALEG